MIVRLREAVKKPGLAHYKQTKWGAFEEEKAMTIVPKILGECHWNGVTVWSYFLRV